ncbi:MAG: 23S rRNA (uracil(1939)-C(5))-methyltransferase RlmD [Lachnospiraceae bacterium]|nr:23S rRNA (uracil(1939)-C(5))-methyltransferase RlmD [Lachnospiraceae bacterium]
MSTEANNRKYNKNETVEILITDMSNEGEGIGKADGFTVFVKNAVIGDLVRVKLMKIKKNYGYGRIEEVLKPSADRIEAPCLVSEKCGGCQIQNMNYAAQLNFKEKKVVDSLVRIGGFDEGKLRSIMEPVIGMEEPYRYRGKSQFPFGVDKEGNPVAGFYAGHTHSIISNSDCLIGVSENQEILNVILEHIRRNHISIYDEKTGKGLVRHVLIRKGFATGEIMVCLVLNVAYKGQDREYIKKQTELCKLLSAITGVSSISISHNTANTNVIMGNTITNIWGNDVIHDVIRLDPDSEGISFAISPLSFYQVNPVQVEKLYGVAVEYAGLTGNEAVWDLYCGIGTISLCMAKKASMVYGVEIIDKAIEDARSNAERNRISNVRFFMGKAEEVLPDFYNDNKGTPGQSTEDGRMTSPDVIVVDPPRKGCEIECLETMVRMDPARIVYVSCNPATLARDLAYLTANGYEVRRFRAVDMFPHSVHVETVCLLARKVPV